MQVGEQLVQVRKPFYEPPGGVKIQGVRIITQCQPGGVLDHLLCSRCLEVVAAVVPRSRQRLISHHGRGLAAISSVEPSLRIRAPRTVCCRSRFSLPPARNTSRSAWLLGQELGEGSRSSPQAYALFYLGHGGI